MSEEIDTHSAIVTIYNKLGLHARASSTLVKTAKRYNAEISLHKGDECANAKSIMDVMVLAATRGTNLELKAKGEEAKAAVEAIAALIADKFGERE